MTPVAPQDLVDRANGWLALARSERVDLARAFRLLGWSYREVQDLIPVPKSTLSGWCRGIELSDVQCVALKLRTDSVAGIPRDTQWKRREQVEEISRTARSEARSLMRDPMWMAGVVMYWAEGSKTTKRLEMANGDERALKLFMSWTRRYLNQAAQFKAALNLHAVNDESGARSYWAKALGLSPVEDFTKTCIKPDGTGHRRNHLLNGVCRVRMLRSTDSFIRTSAWIDVVRSESCGIIQSGR